MTGTGIDWWRGGALRCARAETVDAGVMVMIVVAGCDRSANRILVERLANRFTQLEVAPRLEYPCDCDALVSYMSMYLGKCPGCTRRIVFEEFPLITEIVYGPSVRGGICLSAEQAETLKERLRAHDPMLVLCDAHSPDGIAAAVRARYEQAVNWLDIGRRFRLDVSDSDACRLIEKSIDQYLGSIVDMQALIAAAKARSFRPPGTDRGKAVT